MNTDKVWIRFTAKKRDGTEVKLRIQNLPKNRINDAIDFYIKFMVPEESFHKAAGISKNEDAIAEARGMVSYLLQEPNVVLLICCLDDIEDVGEIIAMSGVQLQNKDDPDGLELLSKMAKSEEIRNLFHIVEVMDEIHDFMKKFNLDECWCGRGVCVDTRYRGLGIAQELFKARYMLCEEYKVPMTEAWMTSVGSQKAAERAGWKTSLAVPFEEIAKKTGLDFIGVPELCKAMYIKWKN